MKKRLHTFLLTGIVLLSVLFSYAQTFPVQVIPQLVPPPPVYLSDYANTNSISSKLNVQLLLTDLTESNRQVRLKLYIEGNGINAVSRDFVVGAQALFLDGGAPLLLNSYDLAPYFELQNLQGISAGAYANALPEGLYKYCFEVFDFISGNPISSKSCTNALLFLNEPPFLNLPQNHINLEAMNPQNILFQWTPRHINVSNVEYEFSLVEIWDNTMDPQAVFLASPPIYQTTTRTTTLLYGPVEPQLIEGRRYAWRVQAKALEGMDEVGLFSNHGYSEVFSFTYQGNCPEPAFLEVAEVGTQTATFRWQGAMENINYRVGYRKAVDADGNTGNANSYAWFESDTSREEFTVIDLEPNTLYEWHVGGYCADGTLTFSQPVTFSTMAEEAEAYYNCGIEPTINIANQSLLETLQPGDVVKAGDFNIKVQEVSGSGTFSGKGYTTIGFLKNIKIAVTFTDIKVNTDYQFLEGVMQTVYDPNWSNILDVDDVIDELEDIADVFTGNDRDTYIMLDYQITEDDIRVDPDNEQIIIRDENGQNHTYEYDEGDVFTITDASGDEFTVNPDGSVEQTGVGAEGGPATAANTIGITQGGRHNVTAPSVREIEKHPIAFRYEKANGMKYGLDKADNKYEEDHYPKVNIKGGGSYYPVHKAVQEGGQEDFFLVEVQNSSTYIHTDSLIFKTVTGTEIKHDKHSANTYKLTVKGKNAYLNEEAIITYKDSTGKQHVLSSFFIHHVKKLPVIDVNVVLVNGAETIIDLEQKVNDIYAQAGVQFNIDYVDPITIDASVWDVETQDGQINFYEQNFLQGAIPDELKAIKEYYKQNSNFDSKAYYLFILGKDIPVSHKKVMGIMAGKTQWGYLFEDNYTRESKPPLVVAGHELGHGVFNMKHPFDDDLQKQGDASTWLMDYLFNKELSFINWAEISSDKLQLNIFPDTQDSQNSIFNGLPTKFQNPDDKTYTFLTLNGSYITLPENVRDLSFVVGIDHINTHTRYATGALKGFRIGDEYFIADAFGELPKDNVNLADFSFSYGGFTSKKTGELYRNEDRKKYHQNIIVYKADYGVKKIQKIEVPDLKFEEGNSINILNESDYSKFKNIYNGLVKEETNVGYATSTPYDPSYKLNEDLINDFIGNETQWNDKYLIVSKLALLNNSYPNIIEQYFPSLFSSVPSDKAYLVFKESSITIDSLKSAYIDFINKIKQSTSNCLDFINNLSSTSDSGDIITCIKTMSDDEIKEISVVNKVYAISILLEDIRVDNDEEIEIVRLLKFTKKNDIDNLFDELKGKSKIDDSKFILKELIYSIDNDHTWTSEDNYRALLNVFVELALKSEVFKELAVSYNEELFTERNINFYHYSFWDGVKELAANGFGNNFSYILANPKTDVDWLSENSILLSINNSISVNFFLEVNVSKDPLETDPFHPIWFINRSSLSMLSEYNKDVPLLSPAILAYYAKDIGGTQNTIDGIETAVDVASLVSGYGALVKGPSTLRKVFIIADMIGSGVNLTLNSSSENLSPEVVEALQALNALTAIVAVTDLASNAKNLKTLFTAASRNTKKLPSKNDIEFFLEKLTKVDISPQELSKIGKNKIEEAKVWLKHIEAEAITNKDLGNATDLRVKVQNARAILKAAEDIIDDSLRSLLRSKNWPDADIDAFLDVAKNLDEVTEYAADTWKLLKDSGSKYLITNEELFEKFNELLPNIQKYIAKFTDVDAGSKLAKFIGDLDDNIVASLNNNELLAHGLVGHKLNMPKADYETIGELLDDLDDITPNNRQFLEEWIDRSAGISKFTDVCARGRRLGDKILNSIKETNGRIRKLIEEKLNVNLDGYEVLDEIPITTSNGYMKADIIMIKRDPLGNIDDVIIVENKLSKNTDFTIRQKEGFRDLQNTDKEIIQYNIQYERASLKRNEKLNVSRSRILKISDSGSDNINTINITDIDFIKDLKI